MLPLGLFNGVSSAALGAGGAPDAGAPAPEGSLSGGPFGAILSAVQAGPDAVGDSALVDPLALPPAPTPSAAGQPFTGIKSTTAEAEPAGVVADSEGSELPTETAGGPVEIAVPVPAPVVTLPAPRLPGDPNGAPVRVAAAGPGADGGAEAPSIAGPSVPSTPAVTPAGGPSSAPATPVAPVATAGSATPPADPIAAKPGPAVSAAAPQTVITLPSTVVAVAPETGVTPPQAETAAVPGTSVSSPGTGQLASADAGGGLATRLAAEGAVPATVSAATSVDRAAGQQPGAPVERRWQTALPAEMRATAKPAGAAAILPSASSLTAQAVPASTDAVETSPPAVKPPPVLVPRGQDGVANGAAASATGRAEPSASATASGITPAAIVPAPRSAPVPAGQSGAENRGRPHEGQTPPTANRIAATGVQSAVPTVHFAKTAGQDRPALTAAGQQQTAAGTAPTDLPAAMTRPTAAQGLVPSDVSELPDTLRVAGAVVDGDAGAQIKVTGMTQGGGTIADTGPAAAGQSGRTPTASSGTEALLVAPLAQGPADGEIEVPLSFDGSSLVKTADMQMSSRVDPIQMNNSSQSGHVAAQVAAEMARNLQKGNTRFQMRFDPPELGRVDVRMKVAADGSVQAHLIVDRPETLDMFLRDQRGLERALENAGLTTTSDNLKFSLRDQGGQNPSFAQGDNNRGDDGKKPGDGRQPAQDQDDQTGGVVHMQITAGRSGLDIRI